MVTRAVLFDLFGTLVRFNVRVPIVRVGGTERQTTMPWLADVFQRELPGADFDAFLQAITAVTREIVEARPPEYVEVPSRRRFERALCRLGLPPEVANAHAARLSLAHMQHLASSVELPAGHVELLQALAPRFRLGLVSNFDHAATARALLDRLALAPFLDPIVISEDFGRRKPHPAIFAAALERIGVPPTDAVYVGDSPLDDIVGAANAGLRAVWINPHDAALPQGVPAPAASIRSLPALSDLLA
jgi:putative hydrolase of the HAD superfamily